MTLSELRIRAEAMIVANPSLANAEVILDNDNKSPLSNMILGKDEDGEYIYLTRCK